MIKIIPVIKVNYTILQLVKAFFISGGHRYSDQLKQLIRHYFSVEDVLLTSSCRHAIYMLLKALPQEKVVVPAYTCGVVVEAAVLARKAVIFAEVDRNTLNVVKYPDIDTDTIVIATHQYGFHTDIDSLLKVCKKKNAPVIEDCAGSLGSRINGRLTGTFGDYGVYSFSASKTLQTPTKGGFIISKTVGGLDFIRQEQRTADSKFKIKQIFKGLGFCANKNPYFCKILSRVVGSSRTIDGRVPSSVVMEETYMHDLYEWQAYVALKQFKQLDNILHTRKELAKKYDERIHNQKVRKVKLNEDDVLIRYPIFVKDRDKFVTKANDKGLQFGVGYDAIYYPSESAEANSIIEDIVYLPFGCGYTKKEVDKVIEFVNAY